jgi:hypothetical protein
MGESLMDKSLLASTDSGTIYRLMAEIDKAIPAWPID